MLRKLIIRLLFFISGFRPLKAIPHPLGGNYLERYYLFSIGKKSYYLHRIVRPIENEGMHSHPWWRCWTRVLVGGYVERYWRLSDNCARRMEFGGDFILDTSAHTLPGSYRGVTTKNSFDRLTFHEIVEAEKETWTFFVTSELASNHWYLAHESLDKAEIFFREVVTDDATDWYRSRMVARKDPARQPLNL